MRSSGFNIRAVLLWYKSFGDLKGCRKAVFIPQPKGDINIAVQNLRGRDSFSQVILYY